MLTKYLYGVKKVSGCWYKRFYSFIISLGYKKLSSHHCTYYNKFDENDFVVLLLYVDDMLVICSNKAQIQKLKAQLAREICRTRY